MKSMQFQFQINLNSQALLLGIAYTAYIVRICGTCRSLVHWQGCSSEDYFWFMFDGEGLKGIAD